MLTTEETEAILLPLLCDRTRSQPCWPHFRNLVVCTVNYTRPLIFPGPYKHGRRSDLCSRRFHAGMQTLFIPPVIGAARLTDPPTPPGLIDWRDGPAHANGGQLTRKSKKPVDNSMVLPSSIEHLRHILIQPLAVPVH